MLWALYAVLMLLLAATHLSAGADDTSGFIFRLPLAIKLAVDAVIANPISYFAVSIVLFRAHDLAPSHPGETDGWLDPVQSERVVPGDQHDGLRLSADRRQTGQRPDCRNAVPRRWLHVAVLL